MSSDVAGASAAYWESLFANRSWGSYPPEELVRFIARRFRAVPDRAAVRVLEVGCGPGPNIWYLVREGFTVAGIDGSATAIRQATNRLRAEKLAHELPSVDLRVGDFASLEWADAAFDAVIDIEALYSNRMAGIRRSLDEVRRVLKPGGVFFGKMFGRASTGSETGEALEQGTRSRPTVGPCAGNEIAHFFIREELEELFRGWDALTIDHTQRTDGNGQVHIFEWLVSARKPASLEETR